MQSLILQLQSSEPMQHITQSKAGGYTVIPTTCVVSTQILQPSLGPTHVSSLDNQTIQTKLNSAIQQRKLDAAKIGKGVTEKAQQLFFALAKTLDCSWDGTSIVVMGDIVISSPYTKESCTSLSGNDGPALERIKAIVSNHVA
jgi:hydroxymethylpyrimidine/phosphomethylpyrimidine kinase